MILPDIQKSEAEQKGLQFALTLGRYPTSEAILYHNKNIPNVPTIVTVAIYEHIDYHFSALINLLTYSKKTQKHTHQKFGKCIYKLIAVFLRGVLIILHSPLLQTGKVFL